MPGGVTGQHGIHCLFISLLRKSGIITVDPDLNF